MLTMLTMLMMLMTSVWMLISADSPDMVSTACRCKKLVLLRPKLMFELCALFMVVMVFWFNLNKECISISILNLIINQLSNWNIIFKPRRIYYLGELFFKVSVFARKLRMIFQMLLHHSLTILNLTRHSWLDTVNKSLWLDLQNTLNLLIIKYSVRPTMAKNTLKLNAINYELSVIHYLIRKIFNTKTFIFDIKPQNINLNRNISRYQ